MNLYHVSQSGNNDYDTYSDFVVCAATEEDARNTNPREGNVMTPKDWETGMRRCWYWCSDPKYVEVRFLGVADPAIKPGIICSSFHAG